MATVVTELAHHLVNTVAELEGRLFTEAAAHQRTIAMLKAVSLGEVPADALIVTETGWRLASPPPAPVLEDPN